MATSVWSKVTIAGDLGSGKSTVARLLADALKARRLSTGDIQRQLAEERGLTTLELNEYAETHPEIDHQIDDRTQALTDVDYSFVFDSRMAWHFIPTSFKVYLIVDAQVAAERVMAGQEARREEHYSSVDEARVALLRRRDSEAKRFLSLYGVDCSDPRNYDLVCETTRVQAQDVADLILRAMHERRSNQLWLDPRSLYPTQHIRELAGERAREIASRIQEAGFDLSSPVKVIKSSGHYLIFDGHKRVSGALRAGLPLIPACLVASDSEEVIPGLSAATFVRDTCKDSWLYDWEDGHEFSFANSAPANKLAIKS